MKAFEPRAIEVKRYNLKANYELCLKVYQDTGNVKYFDKAQAIKLKIAQYRRMDVYIERAHRLAEQQLNLFEGGDFKLSCMKEI